MTTSSKLRIAALVVILAGLASVASPAQATSNPARVAALIWQDETVYRPDCPSNDRDHRSPSTIICNDKNCRP